MSYNNAIAIGQMLAQARCDAALSQREIAIRIGKSIRTIKSWEVGESSPHSDEIFDWFAACGASPVSGFQKLVHPDLYVAQSIQSEISVEHALNRFIHELPPQTKVLLLFVLRGEHGSFPPAVISEIVANLHCPLNNRVSVCGAIINNYTFARAQNIDPCPNAPQPPIEDLKVNYIAGMEAAQNGANGYMGRRKE